MKSESVSAVTPARDKRGLHESSNKIDRETIRQHVETFHPTISHYRRAPNRRYLPSDINITFMLKDFKLKHPDFQCAYETYRKTVRELNISFTKLGEEQCEVCEEFDTNILTHDHNVNFDKLKADIIDLVENDYNETVPCQICQDFIIHKKKAIQSRNEYKIDSEKDLEDTIVRSVDLQKVIMLPRKPGNKTAIFTKRIIAFHKTFAAVGRSRQKKKKNNIAVIWHEAIAGRKQEEITSCFVKVLQKERDEKHVIYWLDNCAAQNKNWCLFTTMVV